jgi:phage terminase large subunit-like protein
VAKARLDGDLGEVISKLFNVYQSATVSEWIKAEQVRELQTDRRIDDCKMEDGWNVFAAFDFSHGDDFDAVTFLAYNVNTCEYFADCDAWVNRTAFEKSPYHDLYVKWEAEGWLHVSGNTVVEPEAPIRRVMELDQKGINFIAFGYDAKQSKEPIILLNEWLMNEVGVTQPDTMVVPVSQVFSNYNASVQKIDYCFGGVVRLTFSPSPLWPFEFANCILEEDPRMGNKKPLKRTANAKVDNVQCLCSCFNLEETFSNQT